MTKFVDFVNIESKKNFTVQRLPMAGLNCMFEVYPRSIAYTSLLEMPRSFATSFMASLRGMPCIS